MYTNTSKRNRQQSILGRVERLLEALFDGETDLAIQLAEDLALDLRGVQA